MGTKVHLEGSMAMDYAMVDTLSFCTKYMSKFTPTRRLVWNNKEESGLFGEELEGGGVKRLFNENMIKWAHAFTLENVVYLATFRR
jgi:hypothetical protein